jgi:hypothetical protein
MPTTVPQALDQLGALASSGIPILRVTALELRRLEAAQERISSTELSNVILRDPLLTLRVLSFLYSHRTRSQTHDITTIAHALMMLGLARFFREFRDPPTIDDALVHAPASIVALYAAASRARLASLFARDWAAQRHDQDAEEVMVAALVHDITEPLTLCAWPDAPPQFGAAEHSELRGLLFSRLGLPGLLGELTADSDTPAPRVLNVALACALARACAEGWQEVRVTAALERVQQFLHVPGYEVWDRVRRVLLQAAREWRTYQIRPAAAYLPTLGATVATQGQGMSVS